MPEYIFTCSHGAYRGCSSCIAEGALVQLICQKCVAYRYHYRGICYDCSNNSYPHLNTAVNMKPCPACYPFTKKDTVLEKRCRKCLIEVPDDLTEYYHSMKHAPKYEYGIISV